MTISNRNINVGFLLGIVVISVYITLVLVDTYCHFLSSFKGLKSTAEHGPGVLPVARLSQRLFLGDPGIQLPARGSLPGSAATSPTSAVLSRGEGGEQTQSLTLPTNHF